ncbi:MAG: hypothetical protein M3430_11730 [Acidobacteriota bacterium]|nr:hypothetical protein [Acidobacteriota bacterium]
MSNAKQGVKVDAKKSSPWQNERVRRIAVHAGVLLVVFLLGLIPAWLTARERGLEAMGRALRVSGLQNRIAIAAIDAQRGEYEPARQAASEFYTELRAEIERGRDSIFNQTQQDNLRPLLADRDDTITLLARSDPASAERLADLYINYRQATGEAGAR